MDKLKMNKKKIMALCISLTAVLAFAILHPALAQQQTSRQKNSSIAAEGDVKLPQPSLKSNVSIEQALSERRSLRTYKDQSITLNELSQLLWAAQGITEPVKGLRTAPSPMAMFTLKVYAVTLNVNGIARGAYRYEPETHKLILISIGDKREDVKRPAPTAEQAAIAAKLGHADPFPTTPLVLVITADGTKTKNSSLFYLEAGHVAQNIVLQCVSLGMGGVTTMASYNADKLKTLLKMSADEVPVYSIPVGKK
jgi:SagB-type dehydrogenase family enzyme